jgi:hypothetical protein
MKARIVEPEISIARQCVSKHIPAAVDIGTTMKELLPALFSMWSMPKFYGEDHHA